MTASHLDQVVIHFSVSTLFILHRQKCPADAPSGSPTKPGSTIGSEKKCYFTATDAIKYAKRTK